MALAEPNARGLDDDYDPPKDAKQVMVVARDGAHVSGDPSLRGKAGSSTDFVLVTGRR